jgi:hypothetical protein
VTGKGQRRARAAKTVLGKYRLETAQEETACSVSAQQRLSIPPRTQEEQHEGMPVARGDLLDLIYTRT